MLTIPTFFDILNSTFPNLKYDENSNKIQGLKLVLKVQQQIQLKHQKQFSLSPTANDSVNVPKTTQITINVTSSVPTASTSTNELELSKIKSSEASSVSLSPSLSACSIQFQTPSIPLLTPPTPPVNSVQPNSPTQIKSHSSSVLQTNDLNILNSNIEISNESSNNVESKSLLIKKDIHIKENGNEYLKSEEEKLLENIETRINLIKEANTQKHENLTINQSNLEKLNYISNEVIL